MADSGLRSRSVRFEPDDRPSWPVSLGLAAQYCLLSIGGIILCIAIVVRTAGESEAYLAWAAFAALLVSGITTIVQATRVGRVGAGYILLMGTSGAFIAVSVTALQDGGPGMLATLVAASALFQFLLAARLSLLRRIITPTVAGTVIMLIAVTIMPIILDFMTSVPEGADPLAAPSTVVATLGITIVIILRGAGSLRLWGPVIGVAAGCVVAAGFGLFSGDQVERASWIGVPAEGWPGFDYNFGAAFWALLPAFIFVTLVGAIETIGDSIAIQRVSWKDGRAPDFRAVQGAVAADGMGTFLSGLAATVPNTTYSSSVSIVEITGIAARRVGIGIGVIFCSLAFLPKITAALLSIPDVIIGTYALVLISILFVLGMRVVVSDGIDYRKATVVGMAFWVGYGFQNGGLFTDIMPPFVAQLLDNGMTSGGLVALVLSWLMEASRGRHRRMSTELGVESLAPIQGFLEDFGKRSGWKQAMQQRVALVAEEALVTLMANEGEKVGEKRKLRLSARSESDGAELELVAVTGEGNVEDKLAIIGEHSVELPDQTDLSLRLLRHLAASVRHQKYHDTDILTVKIDHP